MVSACQGLRVREGRIISEHRGILGSETIWYDIVMVNACHCAFIKAHRMYNWNLNINNGLWMIVVYNYRFTDCNKYTILVQNTDNRGTD